MTTSSYAPAPSYTISGTGPYDVPHVYTASDELTVAVVIDDVAIALDPADYSVVPGGPATSGTVFLVPAVATTHDGKTLTITRESNVLQVWAGLSSTATGLEEQLDQMTRALQENQIATERSLRVLGEEVYPYQPQDGRVPYWDSGIGSFANGLNYSELLAGIEAANIANNRADIAVHAINGGKWLADVAAVVADVDLTYTPDQNGTVVENTKIITQSEGFGYAVAASTATDHHLATAGGVKLYALAGSDGSYSILAFGAVGDGVTDTSARVQAAATAAGLNPLVIPDGTYDLGGATIALPEQANLVFAGGVLANGTLACDNTRFSETRGLAASIALTGSLASSAGVNFDWFVCEKTPIVDYEAFTNGGVATYGPVPAIGSANRIILKMLIDNQHKVRFGDGIYPFDDEVEITGGRAFRLEGTDAAHTLLWAPNSAFIHYTSGNASLPYIRNLTVEASGSILLTDAWAVNSIHGLRLTDGVFISYANHAFYNDKTISGGTGCPIYGTKVENCSIYAGPDMGGFHSWTSGSNIFDNLVDAHLFFDGSSTAEKGIMRAIFWNSNVRRLANSNVTYAGFDYVFYVDEFGQFVFSADNNVYETNANGYKAIVKDVASSFLYIDTRANQYIGAPTENGLHYHLLGGNSRIYYTDSPTPLYSSSLQNASGDYIRGVTEPVDVGGTKSRLVFMEPHTLKDDGTQYGTTLIGLDADVATLAGMSTYYAANSATLSYLEVRPSARLEAIRKLTGGSGPTAQRPTTMLFQGYPYFDTDLGYAIWWNGAAWVGAGGAVV